jgi:membrane-bound serine protease (ClpP class)
VDGGSHGFVLKPVGPDGGMVFVQGEYWKARSPVAIAEKAEIEVVSVRGLVLEVRPREVPGRTGA